MARVPAVEQAQVALEQVTKTVGPARARRARARTDPRVKVKLAAATAMPDPDKLYSESVKAALIDVMLDHSLRMTLGPDEWLTVAARASEGPIPPAGLSDLITIVMRVKGSDLVRVSGGPDQTRRDSRARPNRSPRVLIYNRPNDAGPGTPSGKARRDAPSPGRAPCRVLQPARRFQAGPQGHRCVRRLVRLRHRRRQEQAGPERHLQD